MVCPAANQIRRVPDKAARCDVKVWERGPSEAGLGRRVDEHMSRGDGRSHAWLARKKGESDEPFLPNVGELYLVSTTIYSFGHDPAADRPAVVLVTPESASHRPIQLVTRTSKPVTRTSKPVPGISHPADTSLKLDRDGVFSDLVSVERQLWTPQNVEYLGILPEPFLSAVLGRFS